MWIECAGAELTKVAQEVQQIQGEPSPHQLARLMENYDGQRVGPDLARKMFGREGAELYLSLQPESITRRTVILDAEEPVELEVEVADTHEKQRKGLMGRSEMSDQEGMLFPYWRDGRRQFWMKNTVVPLEAIFISPDEKVREIKQMEPLDESGVSARAQYVLEVPRGWSERHGLSAGDTVEVDPEKKEASGAHNVQGKRAQSQYPTNQGYRVGRQYVNDQIRRAVSLTLPGNPSEWNTAQRANYERWVKLLMGTAAQESNFGRHKDTFRPQEFGQGVFQFDDEGYEDTLEKYHPGIHGETEERIQDALGIKWSEDVTYRDMRDPFLGAVATMRKYLPYVDNYQAPESVEDMARLYKFRFNSKDGDATQEEFINNYRQHVEGQPVNTNPYSGDYQKPTTGRQSAVPGPHAGGKPQTQAPQRQRSRSESREKGNTIRVPRGATLSELAQQNGTSVSALVAANKLPNPDHIRAGQSLVIPSGRSTGRAVDKAQATSSRSQAQPQAPQGWTYTVQKGDTVSDIYQQNAEKLKALGVGNWEDLWDRQDGAGKDPHQIQPGMEFTVKPQQGS